MLFSSSSFSFGKIWPPLISLVLVSSCNYTVKIKDGKTAFERKQYAAALPLLQKEFDRAKTRSERGKLAWMAGESCSKTGQTESANKWYRAAADNNFGPDALRAAAFGLKKVEKYTEAAEAFRQLGIEIGSPYEYRKEIANCKIAADWLAQAPRTGVSVEPAGFNSPANDFGSARLPDGRIAFTSDRPAAVGKATYQWTGERFMDIFAAEPNSSSAAQLFDSQINTTANEGSPSFNATGTVVYFVRAVASKKGDDALNKIFVSHRDGDSWDVPEMLDFQKEKVNYTGPAASPDGQSLFFSADDRDGLGGFDLYFVKKNSDGDGWQSPVLLPRNLNTPGDERFPTLDGDTLYFSSDGLAGMGGLDIFKTYRMDKTGWAPPQNLRAPINSGADDLGILMEKKSALAADLLGAGWFTSNRPGGAGGDDIYRFTKKTPPPAPPTPIDTVKKEVVYRLVLEGYVLEKIFQTADDPNSKLLGRRPLGGSEVTVSVGKNKRKLAIGDDGFFKMELEEASDYQFLASKTGFLSNTAKFSTRGIARDPANPTQVFEVEIVLDKIFKEKEITLENIYYDYDKADIRPDAEPTLNRLAEVLQQNPSVKIQLGSHTDCRGNDGYNQSLSQRRAEAAVGYLISKGVAAERLAARGYGESSPAVGCNCPRCTEEEHQANRRTTFKVVELQ